jgi:prophage antirepressor-like protein
MGSELINICYKGNSGESDIRTINVEDIVHVSLLDVLKTLSKENSELGEKNRYIAMPSVLKTVASTLEEDEYLSVPVSEPKFKGETEMFVTHPGLYRVISGDKSPAAKKFQKWLFHEVVPSIVKYGVYPPPTEAKGSLLSQMAEILAQNSRNLADSIAKQEIIEAAVTDVQNKVGSIESRLHTIESHGQDLSGFITAEEQLARRSIFLSETELTSVVAWCENINLSSDFHRIPCPMNNRLKAKFAITVIDEAYSMFSTLSK